MEETKKREVRPMTAIPSFPIVLLSLIIIGIILLILLKKQEKKDE